MTKTPLDILLEESMAPKEAESLQAEMASIQTLPPSRKLRELRRSDPEVDASDLIAERFLYRGGICLLVGPTGAGKSSLLMQIAIHLAVGKTLFGLQPGVMYRKKGMRILLVQAENDEAELAKMRDGVLQGTDTLTEDEKAQAQDRIIVCTINDRSGDRFSLALDNLLTELGPFDLVIVDPAFAYLGGDSNSQKDVSRFMRELLNPLLQRHDVGLILAHHTNKPPQGKEKSSWAAGDFAYLGAGSAEWINPSRAALAIRSIGSDSVFELRAPKRGKNLGWEDADGETTVRRYIAHFKVKGVICWREADPEEVEELMGEEKPGRRRKVNLFEVLHCINAREGQSQRTYRGVIRAVMGFSETAIHDVIGQAVAKGYIRFTTKGKQKQYTLTEKGKSMVGINPTTTDWPGHWSEMNSDQFRP